MDVFSAFYGQGSVAIDWTNPSTWSIFLKNNETFKRFSILFSNAGLTGLRKDVFKCNIDNVTLIIDNLRRSNLTKKFDVNFLSIHLFNLNIL